MKSAYFGQNGGLKLDENIPYECQHRRNVDDNDDPAKGLIPRRGLQQAGCGV